jgi:RNA polymerase subunit RPABC4/transcription elongation factor Spt4
MGADGALDRFGGIAGGFIGEFIGDVAALPIVRLVALAIACYTALLWLAAAWWAMQDLRRRHDDPVLPYLAAAMVVLASPVLFPLALVVYLIVRPSSTLGERRRLALEERLDELEAEGGAPARCPRCAAPVETDWLRCPTCRSRLGYACAECGRAMGSDWTLCPWCGAQPGRHQRRVAPDALRPTRRRATAVADAPAARQA